MNSGNLIIDVAVQVQEAWEAYNKERQLVGNLFAIKHGTFSLLFDAAGDGITQLYKDCGFTEDQFTHLDHLLLKVEQLFLYKIYSQFESFKVSYESSGSRTDKKILNLEDVISESEKLVENPHIDETNRNIEETPPGVFLNSEQDNLPQPVKPVKCRKRNHKESSVAESDRESVQQKELSDMGRGKRIKFAKQHFDIVQDKQIQTNTPHNSKREDSLKRARNKNSSSDVSNESLQNQNSSEKEKVSDKSKKSEYSSAKNLESSKSDSKNNLCKREQSCVGTEQSINVSGGGIFSKAAPSEPVVVLQDISKKTELSSTRNEDSISVEAQQQIEVKEETTVDKEFCSEKGEDKPATGEAGERTDFECDLLAPIICSLCKIDLPKSRDLIKHWKDVHKADWEAKNKGSTPPNLFYCDVCKETFPAARKFKFHYRIHSGARPHKCQICGKGFRIFNGLRDHMLCHTKERRFACPQCPKTFMSKKLLNKHVKGHNNEIEPRVCELCGKQYRTLLGLKLHYKVHAGIRSHKCSECGMAFTQRCSLQIHQRLHKGDKRHVCDVCGWRFNTNTGLVTHRRVHTGEKPYACSQCSFRATSSSSLRDHELVHTQEKNFKCQSPGCNKRFKRQAHLICHLKKKHPRLKAYECDLCGSRFAMVSELMHHRKSDACEGGKIKKAPSPEPEPEPEPESTFSTSSNISKNPGVTTEKHVVVDEQGNALYMLESASTVRQDADGPKIFPKRKSKTNQPVIQEIQMTSEHEIPSNGDIVIQIVNDGSDIVFTEEEMAAIVRLSQQI